MDFDPDAWFTSPRKGRAVRGKSDIEELQLVGGVSGPGSAGVDRRRFIDGGDWSTREQELADEFGQPERKHRYAVCPRGNAQQPWQPELAIGPRCRWCRGTCEC